MYLTPSHVEMSQCCPPSNIQRDFLNKQQWLKSHVIFSSPKATLKKENSMGNTTRKEFLHTHISKTNKKIPALTYFVLEING